MLRQIFNVSFMLIEIFEVLLLIFSLIFCFRKYNPPFLRTFPVYCAVNLIAEIAMAIDPAIKTAVFDFFTVFEMLYFCFLLTRLIRSQKIKSLLWILAGLVVIYLPVNALLKNIESASGRAIIFECIILITGSLVFFREIFSKPIVLNLEKQPSFWIVTGILFYFTLLMPTVVFTGYFIRMNMPDMAAAFYSINNYSQIISYVLFIKGMTCRRTA